MVLSAFVSNCKEKYRCFESCNELYAGCMSYACSSMQCAVKWLWQLGMAVIRSSPSLSPAESRNAYKGEYLWVYWQYLHIRDVWWKGMLLCYFLVALGSLLPYKTCLLKWFSNASSTPVLLMIAHLSSHLTVSCDFKWEAFFLILAADKNKQMNIENKSAIMLLSGKYISFRKNHMLQIL